MYKDTNGEIWKEWKDTAFHNWHSVTGRRDDETWVNQKDDGETKTILGLKGTDLNNLNLKCSRKWQEI
jgi:hypothetical protein